MAQYTPPLRDLQFVMHELHQVETELNHSGDREGCRYDHSQQTVTTPKGYKEAYQQYVEAGWPALGCDPAYGGQGLPHVVSSAMLEMLNSANQAWTMYPGLSHGAYACLRAHGTEEQKSLYLPLVAHYMYNCMF